MVISSEEYDTQLQDYLKNAYDMLETKPNGLYGRWAFQAAKEREFKQNLKEQGILVDKEHIKSYN